MDKPKLPAHGLLHMPKSPPFSPDAHRVIDVLTYPAVQLLDVTGPVQVFASANKVVGDAGGAQPYVLRVVAQGGESATCCVIHAMSVHGFAACRARISRHVGRGFHGMSVQRFMTCRSSV
jgi:transcriptional regulator GlxA family with amidase domain